MKPKATDHISNNKLYYDRPYVYQKFIVKSQNIKYFELNEVAFCTILMNYRSMTG